MKITIKFQYLFLFVHLTFQTQFLLSNKQKLDHQLFNLENIQEATQEHVSNELAILSEIKKLRKTQEGHNCLRYWKHEGTIINGCTTKIDPYGNQEKEWCRFETNVIGDKDWSYCEEDLDFDQVRQAVSDIYEQGIEVMNKITLDLEKLNPSIIKTIEQLEKAEKDQEIILGTINDFIIKEKQIKQQQQDLQQVQTKLDEKNQNLREILEKDKSIGIDDPLNILSWCKGNELYEEPELGDGLDIHIYNNEAFFDEFQTIKINNIDLNLDQLNLKKKQSLDNVSFEIKGYLKSPLDGEYTFYFDSDAAIQLIINKQILIDHFVTNYTQPHNNQAWGARVQSKAFAMKYGSFYELKIKYWRSVHQNYYTNFKKFLIMYWSSQDINIQKVPDNFFYSKILSEPLLITEFLEKDMHLDFLRNWDFAFKNEQNFILSDIPYHFDGEKSLKMVQNYTGEYLEFKTNLKINLYVAIFEELENPLPSDFILLRERISVLKVRPANGDFTKILDDSYIIKNEGYNIYEKKNIFPGKITIPIKKLKSTISLLVFFSKTNEQNTSKSCGGSLIELTSQNEDFQNCYEQLNDDALRCTSAFSSKTEKPSLFVWEALEVQNKYITIKLKKIYEIKQFEYQPNPQQSNNIKAIQIVFESGNKQHISLKKLDTIQKFDLNSEQGKFITIQILQTFDKQTQIGGFFRFFGHKCDFLLDEKQIYEDKEFLVDCGETMKNHLELSSIKVNEGDIYKISCVKQCTSPEFRVYGSLQYQSESDICGAATHAGMLQEYGGRFLLKITPFKIIYKGSQSNGVISLDRSGNNEYSLSPIGIEQDNFIPFINQEVDYISEFLTLKGVIQEIQKIDNKYALKIQTDKGIYPGFWPSENVNFCGQIIQNRICDIQSQNPQLSKLFNLKVCFGIQNNCGKDYINSGLKENMYKQSKFGWKYKQFQEFCDDKDQSKCYVEFSKRYSQACLKSPDHLECKSNQWIVSDVPKGTYNVHVQVDDTTNIFKNNLVINGHEIISKKISNKSSQKQNIQLQHPGGNMILTDDCQSDCDFITAKISSIQILQQQDKNEKQENSDQYQQVPQLISFGLKKGGYCNNKNNQQIEFCVWDSIKLPNIQQKISQCINEYFLYLVPDHHIKDKSLANKYICMKKIFETRQQCEQHCPQECFRNQNQHFCGPADKIIKDFQDQI